MRETLVDFLKGQKGYYLTDKDKYLRRPNGMIAAEYKKDRDKWETHPIQEEMILYEQLCGRGFPSSLGGDLTNTEIPRLSFKWGNIH